jgi:hypothetical protein
MDFREIVELFVALAGIAGFFFGLFQYRAAQKWKRLEYAANQLQRLTSDPDLVLAITFLEYSKMNVPLPEKYWELAGSKVFPHSQEKLSKMMDAGHFENSPEYLIYREAFMRLFEYFQQIYQFIDMGLIDAKDVKGLRWVLDNVACPQRIDDKTLFKRHLAKGFQEVCELLKILKLSDCEDVI